MSVTWQVTDKVTIKGMVHGCRVTMTRRLGDKWDIDVNGNIVGSGTFATGAKRMAERFCEQMAKIKGPVCIVVRNRDGAFFAGTRAGKGRGWGSAMWDTRMVNAYVMKPDKAEDVQVAMGDGFAHVLCIRS